MPTEALCAALASCFCAGARPRAPASATSSCPACGSTARAERAGRELRYEPLVVAAAAPTSPRSELAALLERARRVCWVSNMLASPPEHRVPNNGGGPMTERLIVIGGGGAGTAAATIAKRVNPDLRVTLFTEFPDIAYSPCGIPFVHGREIPRFEDLFLSTVERYVEDGLDMPMETTITDIDLDRGTITARNTHEGFDKLVLSRASRGRSPMSPGANLDGLHYVKDIRAAMLFDEQLDGMKRVVVIGPDPARRRDGR